MPLMSNMRIVALRVLAVATVTIATPVFAQEADGPLNVGEPTNNIQSTGSSAQVAQPVPPAAAPSAPNEKATGSSQPSDQSASAPSTSLPSTNAATPPNQTTVAQPSSPTQSASAPMAPAQMTNTPKAQAAIVHRNAALPALAIADVNMRSEPGTNSQIVTTIPGGSTVRVMSCSDGWCAVTWNGRSGFAIARNLDTGGSRQARLHRAPRPYAEEDDVGPDARVVYEPPGYYPPPPVIYGPGYYGYYAPRYYYGRGWRRW